MVSTSSSGLVALLGIGFGDVVSAVLRELTTWIAGGASAIVTAVGRSLNATTAVTFGTGFTLEYDLLRRVGLGLVTVLVFAAVINAVIRQDLALLLRAVLVRLPLALMGAGGAIELVSLCLSATDQLSGALIGAAGGPTQTFFSSLSSLLAGTASGGITLAGFEGLLFALILALVSFSCWLELLVRAAAIDVACLFLPLALAGVVWPATAQWARRLAEMIAALILAKLVIAGVFGLAAATLATATGIAALAQAIAMFALASCAPFTILRLVPAVEAGAIDHLGSLGARLRHDARRATGAAAPLVAEMGVAEMPLAATDPIGFFRGEPDVDRNEASHFAPIVPSDDEAATDSDFDDVDRGHR
jgi:hypothetical protein